MTPKKQDIASFDQQIGPGADGQQYFSGDVTIRQVGQNRHLDLLAQPVHDTLKFVTAVVWRELEFGKLTQHNGLLTPQHSGVQQLGQHALNPIRVFADIFQKQDARFDVRKIRRSEQGIQHRQVAAPGHRVLD